METDHLGIWLKCHFSLRFCVSKKLPSAGCPYPWPADRPLSHKEREHTTDPLESGTLIIVSLQWDS